MIHIQMKARGAPSESRTLLNINSIMAYKNIHHGMSLVMVSDKSLLIRLGLECLLSSKYLSIQYSNKTPKKDIKNPAGSIGAYIRANMNDFIIFEYRFAISSGGPSNNAFAFS